MIWKRRNFTLRIIVWEWATSYEGAVAWLGRSILNILKSINKNSLMNESDWRIRAGVIWTFEIVYYTAIRRYFIRGHTRFLFLCKFEYFGFSRVMKPNHSIPPTPGRLGWTMNVGVNVDNWVLAWPGLQINLSERIYSFTFWVGIMRCINLLVKIWYQMILRNWWAEHKQRFAS